MNWLQAIENIDRTKNSNSSWAELETFTSALGLTVWMFHEGWDERMRKFWVSSWICTDTRVGLAAYYLDDELVAVSYQQGRKYDEIIEFVSEDAAGRVRKAILKLAIEDKVAIADMGRELDPEWFKQGDR